VSKALQDQPPKLWADLGVEIHELLVKKSEERLKEFGLTGVRTDAIVWKLRQDVRALRVAEKCKWKSCAIQLHNY
jgi:hypothetical protein